MASQSFTDFLRNVTKRLINYTSTYYAEMVATVPYNSSETELFTAGNPGDVDILTIAAGANNIGKVDVPTATPTAYNVTLTVADTEYSQALPANCRGFEFQARTEADVRWSFVTGKVATPTAPWLTLKAGDYYSSPQLNQLASPSTLYLGTDTAGTIVEILAWT